MEKKQSNGPAQKTVDDNFMPISFKVEEISFIWPRLYIIRSLGVGLCNPNGDCIKKVAERFLLLSTAYDHNSGTAPNTNAKLAGLMAVAIFSAASAHHWK